MVGHAAKKEGTAVGKAAVEAGMIIMPFSGGKGLIACRTECFSHKRQIWIEGHDAPMVTDSGAVGCLEQVCTCMETSSCGDTDCTGQSTHDMVLAQGCSTSN